MTEVFRVYLARGYFCPPTILAGRFRNKELKVVLHQDAHHVSTATGSRKWCRYGAGVFMVNRGFNKQTKQNPHMN